MFETGRLFSKNRGTKGTLNWSKEDMIKIWYRDNTEKTTLYRVPLVATYHPDRPNLREIFRRRLPILHISPRVKLAVPELPLVANRRPPNLKDLLVRTSSKPPLIKYEGSSQCRHSRCKTCVHIKVGTRFSSATTGEKFHARANRV